MDRTIEGKKKIEEKKKRKEKKNQVVLNRRIQNFEKQIKELRQILV